MISHAGGFCDYDQTKEANAVEGYHISPRNPSKIMSLETFLKNSAAMMETCSRPKQERHSSCLERFVLNHGRPFKFQPMPKELKPFMGRVGQCFLNATRMALSGFDSVHYCEGWATTQGVGFPLLHGFCVSDGGIVIDPTWPDGEEYFGVVFKKQFVFETMRRREIYGIMDDWESDYPILKLPPSQMIHDTLNVRERITA